MCLIKFSWRGLAGESIIYLVRFLPCDSMKNFWLTEGALVPRTIITSGVMLHRISTFLPLVRLMAEPGKAEGQCYKSQAQSKLKKTKKAKLFMLRLQADNVCTLDISILSLVWNDF